MININYPHPVLNGANEDYIDCYFIINMPEDATVVGDSIEIKMTYSLTSPGLLDMVNSGKAEVVLYVESVESEFRRLYKFDAARTEKVVVVNKQLVTKELEVRGYIVASEDLHAFTLPEHNKEIFVAGPSKIRKGDILAFADEVYTIPLENFDPLVDRRSIFSIRQNPDQKDDLTVDFTTYNKITVMLNTEMFEKYQNIYRAPETRTILSTLFAVPVLVDALNIIKNADDNVLSDLVYKKWYQVLKTRLLELQIDLNTEDNMTQTANKLLAHVFRDTMINFNSVFSELMGGVE